jgi:hypothetical protein
VRYNPYRQYTGSFIPNWLLERTEVSSHAKLVFARLAQYAGKGGESFPHQKTLAGEIGLNDKTMRRGLSELIEAKVIESQQNGMGKPNSYFFLRHEWMKDASSLDTGVQPSLDTGDHTVWTRASKLPIEKRIKEENQASLPFQSESFKAAVEMWKEHLKQKKVRTTPLAFKMQMAACETVGEERAIAMIRHSVMGNYQGLFEPKLSPIQKQPERAVITNDGIWQAELDSLCRDEEWNEPAMALKRLRKAREYVSMEIIEDYLKGACGSSWGQLEPLLKEIE